MPDDIDRDLQNLIRRANQENNGNIPILGPKFVPRQTDMVCPVCHTVAEQRAEPVLGPRGELIGPKWLFEEDGSPQPVAVVAEEITKRDENGEPLERYRTLHCLNCFNAWQRRKMMQEIRAQVPQLVKREPENA